MASASREIGRVFIDSSFYEVLGTLKFAKIADLGCGSAERLCRLMAGTDRRGVGIDISAEALGLARKTVGDFDLAGRIDLIQADVTELDPHELLADVDVVTCLLMGHDFWPRENCIRTLRGLRKAFPQAHEFLLVDTCTSTSESNGHLPVFSLAFEIAHAVMGKYLPTLAEWHDVFADGDWDCVATYPISPPPATAIFHLRPRRADS